MNIYSKHRVLVTGAGGPAGTSACRLLSRLGVRVFATDIDPLAAGRFFCEAFEVMAPCWDPIGYQQSLRRLIAQWAVDTVLPTVAEELTIVRDATKGLHATVIVSPQETLDRCHDKRALYTWMTQQFPEFMARWQTLDQAPFWASETYFLKPAIGRGGHGCRILREEERARLQTSPRASEHILMDILSGTEWTVDAYVTRSGAIRFIVPRERIQLSGGISLKGRTVRAEPVRAATEAVLSCLVCRGPVCLQWKADASGAFKLVEINPRLSGAVMITAAAGADPMKCLMEELHGRDSGPVDWKEVTVIRYFDEKIL
jgi:carbamoyl-phosphate synthase large subunit